MSKIGQTVIDDMENHPELYDNLASQNDEPTSEDYNPANFVPLPLAELTKLLDNLSDELPF